MRTLIILLSVITTWIESNAQAVLSTKFPNVKVTIKLSKNIYPNSDSVKFIMTLTNYSDKVQTLLFDKPFKKTYPWGTSVEVEDDKGKSMVQFPGREQISSHLYTEDQLKKLYYKLKPKQNISHTYYLNNVPIFNTANGKLPDGKFDLQVMYYLNHSNKVTFAIK